MKNTKLTFNYFLIVNLLNLFYFYINIKTMAKGIEYRGDMWLTQKKFAEEEKVSIQLVGMWVLRKHVISRYFAEVNKTLIKEGSLKLNRVKHEND